MTRSIQLHEDACGASTYHEQMSLIDQLKIAFPEHADDELLQHLLRFALIMEHRGPRKRATAFLDRTGELHRCHPRYPWPQKSRMSRSARWA